jgi:hypothetical protein
MKPAVIAGLACALAVGTGSAAALPAGHLDLRLSPAIVPLGRTATVDVTGVEASSVSARLVGATRNLGHPVRWMHLHPGHGGWTGALESPEFFGVYPVELRIMPGATVIRVEGSRLRVSPPGALARPTFATPEDVGRWWVTTLPAQLHASLSALRRWQTPAFDHRDPRLHQLLVLAYLTGAGESLGMFVTAVRDTPNGRWQLLEATLEP